MRWSFLLSLLSLASVSTAVAAPARELVVLILVDAMRPDHMGAYGYAKPTTPAMDAFAKEGRRYTRVYANAPWTRPSTTSFLTGQNASRHRTETGKSKLPAGVVTLAERLRKAGYACSAFVANGNGGSLAGLERGFDVFQDPTNTYTKDKRGKVYANNLPTGPFLVDKALTHLEGSTATKEFVFMFLVDPHDPYEAPPELEAMFLNGLAPKRRAAWEYNNNYTTDERNALVAVYDAGIRAADQAVATFFAGLKKQGRYDGATIFISADHGEGFGEHGFYLHAHHFWDEVVRVPLLARGPRIPAGVDERLSQAIDVTATVAALAGADASGLPGQSLLAAAPERGRVISEYNEFGIHRQMITDGHYKVIWQRPADAAWFDQEVKSRDFFPSVSFDKETVHAFDLQADPGEKLDLAAKLPAGAETLLRELRAFVNQSATLASSAP
jgi:arylsulfatase A-like enzyme